MMFRQLRIPVTTFLCGFCLGIAGCKTPQTATVINNDQEKTIGDWAAAQIQSESSVPTDPVVTKQVDTIAKRLDTVLTIKTVPRILISDSDTDIVASLPGGWVVISAKMVTLLQGHPDALAGVLAHEFAHVENDDAMRQMVAALGADTMVNMTTQGKFRDASNVAVQLINFSHDRDDEYHTDVEETRIAYDAGYDPHGIIEAIGLLRNADPADSAWLQVHPVTSKRIKLLTGDINNYPSRKTN